MTYREIAYMCLDELKLSSDDSYFTIDHILFLLSKVRATILKQKYSDIKKDIPDSNYQTICIDLEPTNAIDGTLCDSSNYLRSIQEIPTTMSIGSDIIYPIDYYQSTHITFVSRERMRYVGNNKWLQNIIYVSRNPDGHLYFKSSNPQFLFLEKVRMTGIFENPEEVAKLECSDTKQCDVLDSQFPLEEGLVTTAIELVVKYLSGAAWSPRDTTNNANDELSDLMSFLRRNMKSDFQKKIEND